MKIKQVFTKFVKQVKVWWTGTPIISATKKASTWPDLHKFSDHADPNPDRPIKKLVDQKHTTITEALQKQGKFIK